MSDNVNIIRSTDKVGATTAWLWLFPVTYLIHIAEEYWIGGGYFAYLARTRGVNLTPARFIFLNGIGCALIVIGIFIAQRLKFPEWLLVCLGAVVAGNGLTHTVTALRAAEYNPGLASGLLIWLPLGAATLWVLRGRMRRRRYWSAVAIGVAINVVVSVLALNSGKL